MVNDTVHLRVISVVIQLNQYYLSLDVVVVNSLDPYEVRMKSLKNWSIISTLATFFCFLADECSKKGTF